MHVRASVGENMHVCVCACVCMCTRVCIYACAHVYAYMHVHRCHGSVKTIRSRHNHY